jgi:hypothetical protein
MTAAYPLALRTVLRAPKSRTQPAAFRVAEPRRGYAYSQATGTDTPVFWDVAFRFTQAEALIFQLWFEEIISRGVDEFTMPIRTEFGTLTYTCRFLADSLLPTEESGETFGYKATIMARKKLIPDGYREAAELITTLPAWLVWAEYLDSAVNAEMPTG